MSILFVLNYLFRELSMSKKVIKSAKCVLPRGIIHSFSTEDIENTRVSLSAWYQSNQRDMPWRSYLKSNPSATRNQHAYAVWVSEIMLQQTRVATVVPYYVNWMDAWPSVEALSVASDEVVREKWSGLGYYSRARNLLAGARVVTKQYSGVIPSSSRELHQCIPGIGPYTAAAIASIVFGERVGVVDGNVLRVLSRVRAIGADIASSRVRGVIQELMNVLVDPDTPGDFNQAIMELGALVCTPSTPDCGRCPIQSACVAYRMDKSRNNQGKLCHGENIIPSIDIPCVENCDLCLEKWNEGIGVANFPRKEKKVVVKEEYFVVCVCEFDESKYCLVKRPPEGLLASFWEFPTLPVTDNEEEILNEFLESSVNFTNCVTQFKGRITHVFTHLSHEYSVYHIKCKPSSESSLQSVFPDRECRWVGSDEFYASAVSTGMKKVFKLTQTKETNRGRKRGRTPVDETEDKQQQTLKRFFTREK